MKPLRSLLRWLWNVLRDPALYVIAFTFYAGLNPRLTFSQLALCYAGTVLVVVVTELWQARHDASFDFAADVGGAVARGSFLFLIGFGWGLACGYLLIWMPF